MHQRSTPVTLAGMADVYFLRKEDYYPIITQDNLNVVIDNNDSFLRKAELRTQAELTSYLSHRFDTSLIFAPLQDWQSATVYRWGDRIYLTAQAFSATATYSAGERVVYQQNAYAANTNVSAGAFNPAQWDLIATEGHCYMDTSAWIDTTAYTTGDTVKIVDLARRKYYVALSGSTGITPGTAEASGVWAEITSQSAQPLNNTRYWQEGDSRPQDILGVYIDVCLYHIHSQINPRNIPELRMNRRDEGISWLKLINEGKVTPGLPLIVPEQGNNVRYGSGNIGQRRVNNFY